MTPATTLVETEMIQHVPDRVIDKLRAQIPVRYITGQVWSANGGMEM